MRVGEYGQQIDMNADKLIRMRVAHPRGGDGAPIAALNSKALVAERVAHELGERIRHFLHAETLLPGVERKAIARQRRRDDREGVARITAETRGISEPWNEVHELKHRAGPAVPQKQGRGLGPFPGDAESGGRNPAASS